MLMCKRRIAALTAAGAIIGAWGCDGGVTASRPTGSTTEAEVKGKVQVNGKTLKGGKVIFMPGNESRPGVGNRKVDIGADGTYVVKTLVGPNGVLVEAPETQGDPRLYSQQNFDVQGGTNTFDISVPPK